MPPDSPEQAIIDLVASRDPGKTICPSEAARALAAARGAPGEWRAEMDRVHAAARRLANAGEVALMQGAVVVTEPVGAYRIGTGDAA